MAAISNVDPLILKFATHNKIVLRVGGESCLLSLKCKQNALCIAVIDSFFFEKCFNNECAILAVPVHKDILKINKKSLSNI